MPTIRYLVSVVVLALGLAASPLPARTPAGQPAGAPPARGVADERRQHTDEDMKSVPDTIESLSLRGQHAFGMDKVTDEGVRHFERCTKLRVLRLVGLQLTDRALESIGKLPALEELDLSINNITGDGLRHLAGLKHLRKLNVGHNPLGPEAFATLSQLVGLKALSAQYTCPVTDEVLARCAKLQDLEELHLDEHVKLVSDAGLTSLSSLKQLTNVSLYQIPNVTDAGLAKLGELRNLRHLNLGAGTTSHSRVTVEGLRFLDKLTELRVLEIAETPVDERTVKAIGAMTHLETLLLWNVSNERLSLEPIGKIKSLRKFRTNLTVSSGAARAFSGLDHLQELINPLTEITDEDLAVLARLPELQYMELESRKITPASLRTLAGMKSLRHLRAARSVPISPAEWTELGERFLPACRIEELSPQSKPYYTPPTKD